MAQPSLVVPASAGAWLIARLHFGEIHYCAGDVVDVVRENVQRDVGDGLDDVAVGQAGGACLLEVGVADFAALHHDAARELEDGVGLLGRGVGMTRVGDVFLREADFAADERVRAEAVAAQVALGDGKGDLLTDLGVETAAGKRAAEVEIALERGGRRAQHAEEIRHDAQLALHAVEELLGFAGRLGRVELSDAVHVSYF